MMRQLLTIVIVVFVVDLLAGCETSVKPSAELIANADYGEPITQASAEKQADMYLVSVLKDPDSRRVIWGPVEQGYERSEVPSGEWMFGYKMLAGVNAKNSYGGYAGSKPYIFFFQDGILKAVYTGVTKVGRSSIYDVYQRVY